MAASRTILVVGAGIGGLTAALALARRGFRVVVLERSPRLQETGAGVQLSPNATRVLIGLGLGPRLRETAVAPAAVRIADARTGADIVRVPLGAQAQVRYGTPYWSIHRADLQSALYDAANDDPDIDIELGNEVVDCAVHANGVTAGAMRGGRGIDTHGLALVGADGLWSVVRRRLGDDAPPRLANRTAWRAVVPAERLPASDRAAVVNLWFGPGAHLVHYPVRSGALINIVAIAADAWSEPGWSLPGSRDEVMARFAAPAWCEEARRVIEAPRQWLKWALADRPPGAPWGRGPVTLLGDAAHPMLPFLAQGAGMAIEDAAALAQALSRAAGAAGAVEPAMRRYERTRRLRVRRAQIAARGNGRIYQLDGIAAALRNAAMRAIGGERLLHRHDWVYKYVADIGAEKRSLQ